MLFALKKIITLENTASLQTDFGEYHSVTGYFGSIQERLRFSKLF